MWELQNRSEGRNWHCWKISSLGTLDSPESDVPGHTKSRIESGVRPKRLFRLAF